MIFIVTCWKLRWRFVSAGWYRGFILKNPNVKVSKLFVRVLLVFRLFTTHLYPHATLMPSPLNFYFYFFIECCVNWQSRDVKFKSLPSLSLFAATSNFTSCRWQISSAALFIVIKIFQPVTWSNQTRYSCVVKVLSMLVTEAACPSTQVFCIILPN